MMTPFDNLQTDGTKQPHRAREKEQTTMKRTVMALLAVAALTAAAFGLWKGCTTADPVWNIIVVTLDTTRADRLGCYGYDKPTTPNIDRLAGSGTRFDMAIAQAAVTPVSHASILTGLYPFTHGLRVLHGETNYQLEEGAFPTLATILKAKGWSTGAFVSAFPVSEYFGLHYGFDRFDTGITGEIDDQMKVEDGRASWAVDKNQRRADVTTEKAIDWLGKTEGSFFLWLHYFDPHDSILVPPKKFSRNHLPKNFNRMSTEEQSRAIYDVEVQYMDRQLGLLFKYLKETNRYNNTIIVVTNDHGEGLGDHDWWYHRILYQEQIRMPLIIRYPGGPKGQVVPDLVQSVDIMPTILECVGIKPPEMDGKSLLPLIRGEEKTGKRIAYSDALIRLDDNRPRHAEESDIHNDLMYCVISEVPGREGLWKLIHRRYHTDSSELYRLDRDPKEERNVINEYPDVRDKLFGIIDQPGIMIDKLIPRAENQASNQLQQLGYK
jgi:arylsulfatase A-like enzyme